MTPRWRSEGTDPDARFSLANERTFLAWVRTSLSLMAGALGISQFVEPFGFHGARTLLMVLVGGLAVVIAGWSYHRWWRVERSLRTGESIPATPMMLIVASCLVAAALLVLLAVLQAGG